MKERVAHELQHNTSVEQQRGLGQFLGSGRQDVDGWLVRLARWRRQPLILNVLYVVSHLVFSVPAFGLDDRGHP